MKFYHIALLACLLVVAVPTWAQDKNQDTFDKMAQAASKGIKIKFNDEGSSYFKMGIGGQFWLRYSDLNPYSYSTSTDQPISSHTDFVFRRMRLTALANYENSIYVYTQLGLTSQALTNDLHRGIFFHDLWAKFKIASKTYIGGGLHMWNGLSRLSNASYSGVLTLDNPTFNFPNVNVDDDFVRQYGVFLQGQLSKFNYQFSVNQPILPNNSKSIYKDSDIIQQGVLDKAYNRYHDNFNFKAYVSYNFLSMESVETTPFKQFSYFGKKGTFLNLGLGTQVNPNASGVLEQTGQNQLEVKAVDQIGISADVWYEQPLANESVLNIYGAYYYYDYGANYLRTTAVAGGFAKSGVGTYQQGPGVNQYYLGTGNIFYLASAYMLPSSIYKSKHKIMPFAAVSYKDFDGLNEASMQYDFGLHYLILNNHIKLSMQYSTRPVYEDVYRKIEDHKGMFITQLQFKI